MFKVLIHLLRRYGPKALKWGTVVWSNPAARRFIKARGALPFAERQARRHAALVVDGEYGQAMYQRRVYWVVWSGDTPLASYPPFDGDDLGELGRYSDPGARRRPPKGGGGAVGPFDDDINV